MTNRRILLLAATLAAAWPAVASAQVTPERAQAIQDQLKGWLQTTVGPAVEIKRSPVTVTASGDHFDLAYRLDFVDGKPSITAKLTEVDGGRWAIDDLALPSPATFRIALPPKTPAGPPIDVTMTLATGRQVQGALIDPSLATPSTASSTASDIAATARFPNSTQITRVDSSSSHSTLTPVGNGRVDQTTDVSMGGYSVNTSSPDGASPTTLSASKVTIASSMTGVSLERLRDLIQLAAQSDQLRRTDKEAGRPSAQPLDRTTQLALLAALSDLMTGLTFEQQLNGVSVASHGLSGSADRVAVGLDAKSVAGKLQLRLPITIAGLHLPDFGLGDMARLIPTRLSLTPHLSSVPTNVPFQLARDAIADGASAPPNVQALFADGPIDLGIDDFRLDVAETSFAGHVGFLVTSPASFTGTGQIIADNLDSLQQTVSSMPQTAQLAPVLVLMKGLARSEGGHLIWDINYRDGHLLVNNQDMQALMGAVAPTPKAPANRPRSAPSPTRP